MTAGSISFSRGEDPLRADKLNSAFSERLLVVGDTMLGPLVLFRDPQVPFEAVTKQYTDALVTGKLTGFLSTTGGTMYGPLFLFRDPQTATEASTKQYTDAKAASVAAAYLPLVGGTLTGNLTLAGDAVTPLHPVTLRQLSAQGSTASIAVGDTPPTPGLNKLWWDSVACQLYIWFDDGTSSQWVPAMAVPASIGEAPSNGTIYGRQNGQWTDVGTSSGATSPGKNLLLNSMFNITQRGVGPWATPGNYTADRWRILAGAGGTRSASIITLTDPPRAAIGDESAVNCWQNSFAGGAGAGDYEVVLQAIENVRRLSGKTVTLSFWANASAALKVGIEFNQDFGTGGSPSAGVNAIGATAITLSNSWTRYTVTATITSTSGKTLGTNGDSHTDMYFWLSSGTTFAGRASNIGVQSGTVQFWGVQLEIGSTAAALEKIDPQQDLAKCQRFYEIGTARDYGYSSVGGTVGYVYPFKVTKRAAPTIVLTNSYASFTGPTSTVDSALTDMFSAYRNATGASPTNFMDTFTASADL